MLVEKIKDKSHICRDLITFANVFNIICVSLTFRSCFLQFSYEYLLTGYLMEDFIMLA